MGEESQTTTNTPSEPVLCKLGCGFFGNAATSGFCSKCWRDVQKSKAKVTSQRSSTLDAPTKLTKSAAVAAVSVDESMPNVKPELTTVKKGANFAAEDETVEKDKVTCISVPIAGQAVVIPASEDIFASSNATEKKKKKKKTYKNMMASMMTSSSGRDADKEKDEAIRKVTGGGAFTKIDKI